MSDMFSNKNGLKQRGDLSPLLFNFAVTYAITRLYANKESLKLNRTHQIQVYVDDVNTRTVRAA